MGESENPKPKRTRKVASQTTEVVKGEGATAAVEPKKTSVKKTPCQVSRKEFKADARQVILIIREGSEEQTIPLDPKDFSTGSFGWYGQKAISLLCGKKHVKVQFGVNGVVANSKDLPKEE